MSEDYDPRWEEAIALAQWVMANLDYPGESVEDVAESLLAPHYEACGECSWCRKFGECYGTTLFDIMTPQYPTHRRKRSRGQRLTPDRKTCRALYWLMRYLEVQRVIKKLVATEGREKKNTAARARATVARRIWPHKAKTSDEQLAALLKVHLRFRFDLRD